MNLVDYFPRSSSGSIALSRSCIGPVNGRMEFDILVPLQTLFVYYSSLEICWSSYDFSRCLR